MTSHLDLLDRDQEDHPAYGPLGGANPWTALNTFSAGIVAAKVGIPSVPPLAATFHGILDQVPPATRIGLSVDIGLAASNIPNAVVGVAGHAFAINAATNVVIGLNFLCGNNGINLPAARAVNAGGYAVGTGRTLTAAYNLYAPTWFPLGASIATQYGLFLAGPPTATAHRPLYDANAPAAGHHSILGNTLQLFSAAPSFGAGVGVLGVANATVLPTVNPVAGGILYAQGGALMWRGSGGTITAIAPA